jgi:WD40 repeat protein/DNA-binding SARP family transcriptional activator
MDELLKIFTLGGVRILRGDDGPVSGLGNRKAEALLIYLARTRRAHPREVLAELLWDERSQSQALSNLRVVLTSLRQNLGDYVEISRESAALKPNARVWLDVNELEDCLTEVQKQGGVNSSAAASQVSRAVLELYQGDFLDGFSVYDCRGFEDWQVREREGQHHSVVDALHDLVAYELECGEYKTGMAHARRLLELDPLMEAAHRQMMLLLAYSGQRGAALAQYETCRKALADELKVEPSPETRALFELIQAGQLKEPHLAPAAPPELATGGVIHERYRLDAELGRGGMGVVYRAHDLLLERDVAVKLLSASLLGSEARVRLLHEARAAAQLNHPNIAAVYDVGEQEHIPYIVMELVQGETLYQRRPGSLDEIYSVTRQICAALEHAHTHGVIHRDLKPENVVITPEGTAKLMDFGLARSVVSRLTGQGTIAGTAFYLAPELILGQEYDGRADLYALGVMLYEQAAGQLPFTGEDALSVISQHLHAPVVPPSQHNPAIPPALDALIEKLLSKRPQDRPATAAQVQEALAELYAPAPGPCPYKGLQFFDEADAGLFFGREGLIERLVERLMPAPPAEQQTWEHFLAVIGASGSGKSSVVRAGLVPALRRRTGWPVYILTPTAQPLEALALSLTGDSESVSATTALLDDLGGDPRSLRLFAKKQLAVKSKPPLSESGEEAEGEGLLLVVDQFEELFSLCRNEAERVAFIGNLLRAAGDDSPLRVVIALRADFYAACAPYDELRQALGQRQEYIGPMSAAELRRAMEEPARLGHWGLEPGLVDLFLRDVGVGIEGQPPEPGALPLLSHALLETWQRRGGRTLTLMGYAEAGGVKGAIAKTAETVYSQLTPEGQSTARNIFLRLTELGEGMQETRRRASLTELIPSAEGGTLTRQILNTLADARLVTTTEDTAEVAHEALIREWGRLQEWLNEDREGLRLHRRLTEAALEWERTQREPEGLYRGARLAQAQEWAVTHPEASNALEREFVRASQELAESEAAEREAQRQRELEAAQKLAETRAQSAQRLRRRAAYLSLAVVVAIGMALAAIVFGQQANRNARLAGQNLSAAQSASLLSQAQKATAQTASTQAVGEANLRATSEADAVQQAAMANSRALAAAAVENLQVDQQLSLLLALQAYNESNTKEAVNALHQSVLASRLRVELPGPCLVGSVASSPDGDRFAAIGQDGYVRIWKMGDTLADIGEPLLAIPNPIPLNLKYLDISRVRYLPIYYSNVIAYSPDGGLLATVGINNTAIIWDARTGSMLHTLEGHTDPVVSLSFSADGRRLATAGHDSTARIWDVKTGQPQATLSGHTGVVYAAVFSPDRNYLVTGSVDQTVIFWDLRGMAAGGQPRAFFTLSFVGKGNPSAVAFSQDGKRLAIGVGKTGWVYEVDFSQEVPAKLLFNLTGHTKDINSIVFTPDGKKVVTAGEEIRTKIWDAETGQDQFTLTGETAFAALSPDGERLFTTNCTMQIWDISPTGNQEVFTIPGFNIFYFSQDGKRWLSVDSSKGNALFWEPSPSGLKELSSFKFDPGNLDTPRTAVPDLDLNRLVTVGARAGEDYTARVWDTASGREISRFTLVYVFPVNKTLVTDLAISPDGTKLVTTSGLLNSLGKAVIWDLATGGLLRILEDHPEPVWSAEFSPDGTRLATGYDDGTASIYDMTSPYSYLVQMLVNGHELGRSVMSVAYNQDGTRLATGSGDGKVIVWDPVTGDILRPPMVACSTEVIDVKFNPDGSLIAAGCTDSKAHVLNASTGQELLVLPGYFVDFSPDGKFLLTQTADNLTYGFYLDINDLIALAQRRLFRTWKTNECQTYLHMQTCPPAP